MNTDLRPSDIEGLGGMSWGTHFCLFYETKEDLLDILIPYLKAGLENNEFFLCIASPPLSTEEAQWAIREAVPDFERYLAEGQIEIVSDRDWLLTGGRLDAQRVLQNWNAKLNWALAMGYAGLRFAGDPSWLDKDAWGDVSEFEEQLDHIVGNSQMLGLCAYALERCSAADLLDVISHHQFALARRNSTWEILQGGALKHAHEDVLKLNAELEGRVMERTAELTVMNEQLRREIAERERTEALLHAKEKEFRAIVESAPDLIIRYDSNFDRTYINPAVTKGFDLPKEKFVGKHIGSVVADAQLVVDTGEVDALKQRIKSVFDTGEPTEYEVTWPLPTGRRTYWSRLFPEFDSNGVVINVLGIARDITERKQMEEALRRSEANFRTLAEKSVQGIAIYQDQKMVYANEAMARITGFTVEELKSMPVEQIVARTHPVDRPIAEERLRKHTAGEALSASVELRILRKDGSTSWIQAFNNSIEYNGQPALLSTALDITERKQGEEALQKSERILREAEALGHTGSWEQNLVTGEIFNTEEDLRLFFGDDHSKGADFEDYAEVVHPDDREYVMQRRGQLLTERGPSDIEYRVVWPDGSVHVIFGRATVVYDELGQAVRVYGTNVDITERKKAEEEIRRYTVRMEALAETSQALAEVGLDVQAVFETIVRHSAELIGDTCAIRLLSSDEQWLESVAFHNPNPEVKALMRLLHPTAPSSANHSWLTPVLRTGQPLLVPIITQEQFRQSVQPEYLPFFEQVGLHSMLIVPLRVKGRVIGTLGLSRDKPGHPYTPDDQVLLQELADRATLTLQNAQLFEQVQGAREQLGALSRRLLEVQESERRALTTELHDRVGQNLTGLSINLQNLKALLSDEIAKTLATKFDDTQTLVEHTTRQIRDIMAELHPPELEDYGLAVALETYAERVALRGNLELIADLPDLAHPPLPPEGSIALFRAAQEAITNVLKHAGATQIEVSLEESDNTIRLRVEDDGQGFEPDLASQKLAQTWGLKIMRERIESMGGNVQIQSEPGAGTRVIFEIQRPS